MPATYQSPIPSPETLNKADEAVRRYAAGQPIGYGDELVALLALHVIGLNGEYNVLMRDIAALKAKTFITARTHDAFKVT